MRRVLLHAVLALLALPAQAHKAQVSDPVVARAIVARGGRLIADYGGWQLVETAQTNGLVTRDNYNFILLKSGRLDTSRPETQALRQAAGSFSGKRLHLVQFAGPVQPAWRQALLAARLQIVDYIPMATPKPSRKSRPVLPPPPPSSGTAVSWKTTKPTRSRAPRLRACSQSNLWPMPPPTRPPCNC
jgi:hypothetical protein